MNWIDFFIGRKSGKGFYVYTPGVKDRNLNEKAMELLKKYHIPPKHKYKKYKILIESIC